MVAVAAEEASGEGELVGESEGAGVTALSSMKKEFVKILCSFEGDRKYEEGDK
jgi:hypothetical protein